MLCASTKEVDNNTKTMIKLYISIAVVAVLSIMGIYYYFNIMTTVNGALNINKIKNVDKTVETV